MEDKAIYEVAKRAPELSMDIIKKYICPKATDQEAFMFLQLCKAQGLNPFLREAYLIKYVDEAATIVTGKDTFTKRADRLPQYDGFKAGIIVLSGEKVTHREGSFLVTGETLLGGWAEVFRKDRGQSFRNEVSLSEYERKKKDGTIMSNWKSMPSTMIRKVALVQSLREAFPDEFGGMYSLEEMPVDASALPIYSVSNAPIYPAPSEEKPPIKEPGKKSDKKVETAAPVVEVKTTYLKGVEMKEGEKDGKKYTIYGITDEDGAVYKTFDAKMKEVANSAIYRTALAKLSYTVGKYGNTLTTIEVEQDTDVPEPEGTNGTLL